MDIDRKRICDYLNLNVNFKNAITIEKQINSIIYVLK